MCRSYIPGKAFKASLWSGLMNFYWIGTRAREALSILPCFTIASGFILEDSREPFPCHSVQRISGDKRIWGCDDLEHPLLTKLYSMYSRDYDRPVISCCPARPHDVHYDQAIWKIRPELDRLFFDKFSTCWWLSKRPGSTQSSKSKDFLKRIFRIFRQRLTLFMDCIGWCPLHKNSLAEHMVFAGNS